MKKNHKNKSNNKKENSSSLKNLHNSSKFSITKFIETMKKKFKIFKEKKII